MADVPATLKYTKDHEWARIEGDRVVVGITQHAVDQLGDVTLVGVDAKVGATVSAGKAFGTVESVKAVSDLFAPVSGTVVEINGALQKTPEVINDDPYVAGWMVVVQLDAGQSLDALMSSEQYDTFLGTH